MTTPTTAEGRSRVYRFGECVLDTRSLELVVGGQSVKLEPKPLELLLFLLRHPGEVVTKDELQDGVWPGRVLSESVLTKAMAKLRQGLGDEDQMLIQTVHGYGYKLVATVQVDSLGASVPVFQLNLKAGDEPPLRPNWVLRERLGGGGYGDVWRGEQPKSGEQRVFKFALDAQGLIALKREITLYRVLKDTHGERRDRVRLLDWNLEEAPYFIESEYVAGGSLPQWSAAQGGLGGVPFDQRLELVAQAAEALAAAHAAGVLHKDLKPSNLLVAMDEQKKPYLKLADFGSGRVVDLARLEQLEITRLGFTRTGAENADSTTGTPAYFAPELLTGQLPTVQTDIYALGVILYQVSVGDLKRPLAPGWEAEVPDELLREDIVAAAATRAENRLTDAGELARRLRSLDERRRERAQREASRLASQRLQRVQALAAVLGVAIVLAATLLWQVKSARDEAQAALREAEAINDFVNEQLLPAADPMKQGGREVDMPGVLARASVQLDAKTDLPPAVAARLGDTLGNNLYGLGRLAEAHERFARSLERSLQALGPTHDATLELRMGYGEVLREQGLLAETEAQFTAVADAAATMNGERAIGWSRRALSGLGWVAHWRGDDVRSLAILEPLVAELENDPAARPSSLAYARWDLSETLIALKRFDEAEARLKQALAHFGERESDNNLLLEWVRGTAVTLELARGRPQQALELAEQILGRVSSRASRQHWAAQQAMYQRGVALMDLGRKAEAEQVLRDALALRRASYGDRHMATLKVAEALVRLKKQ